jgi:hypothetical protein
MKRIYSAPIADLIETEIDNVMVHASREIVIDDHDPDAPDVPGGGFGEVKPGEGGAFGSQAKSSSIFDFDE